MGTLLSLSLGTTFAMYVLINSLPSRFQPTQVAPAASRLHKAPEQEQRGNPPTLAEQRVR